jgi:S-adenosylmethionine:tRNA ribosyltransferase-isomerase
MRTADFHYDLPPELIAQHPAKKRDESRLLVLHRGLNRVKHKNFPDVAGFFARRRRARAE